MDRYNFKESEPKWQERWQEAGCFEAEADPDREKYYVLEMFRTHRVGYIWDM